MRNDTSVLRATAIEAIRGAHDLINRHVAVSSHEIVRPAGRGRNGKILRHIELMAEEFARVIFRNSIGNDVLMIGERELADETLDLSRSSSELVIVFDMIDGMELLAAGLSNWCSAIVFLAPETGIVGTCVGMPGVGIYYAFDGDAGPPRLRRFEGRIEEDVNGTSGVTDITGASIAFNGQRVARLMSVLENTALQRLVRAAASSSTDARFRIYNLGGNPMMIHLIDGLQRIDAVFDVLGQAPIDVIPGAYLAARGGATLLGLDGPIDVNAAFLRPAESRLRYVLAATTDLAIQIKDCVFASGTDSA